MIHNFKARSLLVFGGLLSLLLISCAQRYNNIPRVHVKAKHQSFKSTGHYVSDSKRIEQVKISEQPVDTISHFTESSPSNVLLPGKPKFSTHLNHKKYTPSDSLIETDTTTKREVDKSLIKSSTSLLVVTAGFNAGMILAPSYSFLFIGLLVGLGLLVIGYFISKFVVNSNENKVFPIRVRTKRQNNRSQLKKAFNILMIISGSSFAVALFTAATGSFALPFFFLILGMITLYAGLLVGLIYVIAGA